MSFTPIALDHGVIQVVRGDVTEEHTDAIVNAANNHLWMGPGVAGAIKRRGGSGIEQAAMAQGPVGVGEAVLTKGGMLRTTWVIHAVVMGQDLHTTAEYITAATHNSLVLAEERALGSVSFPALGTGVGGFSVLLCAKIMVTEAAAFLAATTHLHIVRLVLIDEETCHAFEEELKRQYPEKRQ